MKQLTEEQVFAIQVRWACGMSVKACARELEHSLSTISKYYAIAKESITYQPNKPHRFSNRREVEEDNLNRESSIKERTS